MKGMPLPFDFQGKGVLALDSHQFIFKNNINEFISAAFGEPNSVLDIASSSTLSSSHGGGGAASTDTAGVAAVSDTPKWQHDSTTATSSNAAAAGAESELLPVPPSLEIGAAATEKFAMEDWESVLSESPNQEQSILRWIMGDVEDPAMGSLNKVLQIGSAAPEFDFSAGFGAVDQGLGFGGGEQFRANLVPNFPNSNNRSGPEKLGISSNLGINMNPSLLGNNLGPISVHHHQPAAFDSSAEMKPPIFNSHLLINQHQAHNSQNPSFFFPLSYPQSEHNLFNPPQAKRHNPGGPVIQTPKGPFSDTGQQQMHNLHQGQGIPHQLQLLPHYMQQRPTGPKPKTNDEDELGHSHQQAIVDQLYKAAELVQTGNLVLAQGILARLNHHLSPIGKPFHRAAFYCKEALQLLLNNNNNDNNSNNASPFSLIFKIGAYKSFSEISPLIQFANFTCNQALLEVLEGFDTIHIIDFDIGYGGQWASLMQELALRNGGPPALKITALASSSTHDQLELGLTRENLMQFAGEVNISFDFEAMSIDSLNSNSWALPLHVSENEAIAVNLPVGCLATYQLSIPMVLRFVKQLSPRIVVSIDRGCDRTDLPFANHIIHALQSYSNLLESLDAVNVNMDALQKIERFLIQPGLEKIVTGRSGSPEKTQHWRSMFLSSGFTPVAFSNFTESQAECVLKRTPVRGFQVEKRQSSLVLCWQRKELISASAWRC